MSATKQKTISVLVIPQDESKPVARASIENTLEKKQELVGGFIQPISWPDGKVSGYANEDAKSGSFNEAIFNRRATRLFGAQRMLLAGDWLAGDVFVSGFSYGRGVDVDLPAGFEERLATLRELPEPKVTRENRHVAYEWRLREERDGTKHFAVLTAGHHRAGVNMLSGAGHPNEFYATLRNESEEPVAGMFARGYIVGSGLGLHRQETNRFSNAGLERFAEQALHRLRMAYGDSHPLVTRYFQIEGMGAL